MAGSSGGRRLLVVDDVEQMRTLLRRALSASGYEADVACTLTEARAMNPAGYDAVLVDANLGPERGIDLVEEIRSKDPAAARRCLVISGGAVDMLPDGVAYLTKPFQIGKLLEAVRALCQPDILPPSDRKPGIAPEHGAQPPASVPPGGTQPAAGEPEAWQLLDITRRIRARERGELADFLHDGPIQELTAASLELQMLRQSAPTCPAPSLDAVRQLVEVAAGSLRGLVDAQRPFLRPETRLAAALQERIKSLLAAQVTVDAGEPPAGLAAIEVPVIVDIVELMLLGVAPASPQPRVHVAVRAEKQLIQIQLYVTSAAEDDQTIRDPATTGALLAELASALRASAHSEFRDGLWRARIALRRQPASVLQAQGGLPAAPVCRSPLLGRPLLPGGYHPKAPQRALIACPHASTRHESGKALPAGPGRISARRAKDHD